MQAARAPSMTPPAGRKPELVVPGGSMKTLAQLYRLNEANLALRREFMRFTAEDVAVLAKLERWSRRVAAPIAKDFYDHQFTFGPTRAFFAAYAGRTNRPLESVREALERAQAGYFRQIFEEAASGSGFGVAYFERRLQIGKLH